MTEEELAKRADEYVNAQGFTDMYGLLRKAELACFWAKGYCAGTTENGIVWHDLRKNPQDLPTKSSHVVQNQDGDPVVYNNKQKKWFWTDGCCFGLKVIAWCEIPKLKVEFEPDTPVKKEEET